MKLFINAGETPLNRRINQFIKHGKSGYIKQNNTRYIIFDCGKISDCLFDDKSAESDVIECFSTLEQGKIELSVETPDSKETNTKIPYLIDYIILDKHRQYISGNADLEKMLIRIINTLDEDILSSLNWDFDTFFISGKLRKIGIFMEQHNIMLCIFDKKATLSIIKRKIKYLLQ